MFENNLVQMILRFKLHQHKRNIKSPINSIKANRIRKIKEILKMSTRRTRFVLHFRISWPEISNKFDSFKFRKLKNSKSRSLKLASSQLQEQDRKTYLSPVWINFQDRPLFRGHCKISRSRCTEWRPLSKMMRKLASKRSRMKNSWMNLHLTNNKWQ